MDEVYRSNRPALAWRAAIETALIFGLFCLHGSWPTPDSNEAHYLCKAKHYWDPEWCGGDFFLETADAHQVFYWTFGWLTKYFSLAETAWIGRVITWGLLAWGWRRLSVAVLDRPWWSVLTGAAFVGLSESAHQAGEWVVGGVEAKGLAYVFLLFALESLAREKWNRAWLLLGGSAAMHVLVGGWAMVCAGCAWLASRREERPSLVSILPAMGLAVLMAAPSVYWGLELTRGVPDETVREANRIYVFERLPHHLAADRFADGFIPRHQLLTAVWLLLLTVTPMRSAGERTVHQMVGAAVGVAWIGFGLTAVLRDFPPLLAGVMRYYWFRSSDVLVPIGASLALAAFLVDLGGRRPRVGRLWLAGVLAAIVVDSLNQTRHLPFPLPPLRTAVIKPRGDKNLELADWMAVCEWARGNCSPTDVFLTPRVSSSFKWYAGRPEVVTGKDVPQNSAAIVEWWDRVKRLHAGPGNSVPIDWNKSLSKLGAARLNQLGGEFGAQFAIVVLDDDLPLLPGSAEYQNASYAVYKLPLVQEAP